MKTIVLTILIVLSLLLAGCAPTPTAPPSATSEPLPTSTSTPDPDAWELIWSDEFDLPDCSPPDPAKWNHQKGGSGWGNGELQHYTDSANNAYIEDEMLVIKAIEEYMMGRDYTSARLTTQYKGDWTQGRIEIRAKLPDTQGIWPALWMLPTRAFYGTWPAGGEIDIMEMIGRDPNRVYGTLHYGNPHTFTSGTFDLPAGQTFSDDFHVFAVEWEPDEFRWYVDDTLFYTKNDWFTSGKDAPYPAPFDQDFHLLMNVAVGGHWPGNPDESSVFPQTMIVDYVRVYQHPK